MHNLTWAEAQRRGALIEVHRYAVELDLTTGAETFRSVTEIRFGCREPGADSFAEILAPAVHRIELNGQELDAAVIDGDRIGLCGLAEVNVLTVVADCAYSRTGEGLHRFLDPADGEVYLYSQSFLYDAHRIFACFDQPDLKATFKLAVTAPAEWVCVSNAAPERSGDGRWSFTPTPPVSTYLMALVAGPYAATHDRHGDIDLGVYCRRSAPRASRPGGDLPSHQGLLRLLLPRVRLPLRVRQVRPAVRPRVQRRGDGERGGGDDRGRVRLPVQGHLRRPTAAGRDHRARDGAHVVRRPCEHAVVGRPVAQRVLRDLPELPGAGRGDPVHQRLDHLLQPVEGGRVPSRPAAFEPPHLARRPRYRRRLAELLRDQLWQGRRGSSAAGRVGGLGGVRHRRTGLLPEARVREHHPCRPAGGARACQRAGLGRLGSRLAADRRREHPAPGGDGGRRGVRRRGDRAGGAGGVPDAAPAPDRDRALRPRRRRAGPGQRVELDISGPRTEVAELVGVTPPDLLLVNDDDLTYAKIRLDARSLTTVLNHVGEIRESLPRTLCWDAAWDMTRDGELAARDFVRLVAGGVAAENDIGVAQALLANARTATDFYVDPAYRPELLHLLAGLSARLLDIAEPGSDVQLVHARAFAVAATGEQDVATVQALLDGGAVPAGLAMDTELRWHLLQRLVVLGAAGDAEIDAEMGRDQTAAGEQQAATARAARPEAAAKAAAWAALIAADTLSNRLVSSTAYGSWQPEQLDLARPYVDRYFEELAAVWGTRTPEIARLLTTLLYPSLLVDPATLGRTDAYLAAHDPPAGLRRLLRESRYDVARALRARGCDRAASM